VANISENEWLIIYPVNQLTGRSVFLLNGADLLVTFVAKNQTPYQLACKVTGRRKEQIPVNSLQYPGMDELKRIQRRHFFRAEAVLDTAEYPVTAHVSARGLAMILPEEYRFDIDEQVDVHINLPTGPDDRTLFSAEAEVKRLQRDEKSKNRILSVEFSKISKDQQHLLMKYCFHQQITLKRKRIAE
jgi:c-di-GMP-binding flagellar brake protein YcgR